MQSMTGTTWKIALTCVSISLACVVEAKTVDIGLEEVTFSNPIVIDNPYWPLPEGATFTYFAETQDGCEYDVLTVTPDTRIVSVGGTDYTVRIVRDQAWIHEPEDDMECDPTMALLEEDTRDYYAQDDDGNIWYFGEDTWARDDETEECSQEGSWEAGVGEAEPGIVMLAEPMPGLRYRQEFWEDEAEDWGAVLRLNATVSIDQGDYEDCLVTREWTALEPGSVENKFYCPEAGNPGPGLVYVKELKGKTVNVEYTGTGPLGAPGENSLEFPAAELGCEGD